MVTTAVPVTNPIAPQPESKRLVEAGALLPTIHVAGLSCPQVTGKHWAPSPPSPVSALPPTPEKEPAAGSRALPLWPRVLAGPHPRIAKGDPEIGPLSQLPHNLEKQCPLCLPVGGHVFSTWQGGMEVKNFQTPTA